MLNGSADVDELAARAPTMERFDADPLALRDVEVFQAAFELPYASRTSLLPPGLHPTTPPLLVVLAWRVGTSPWGPFALLQARVSCRSGVRPRGFVVAGLVDNPAAGAALGQGWGFPTVAGAVELRRGYDRVELTAGRQDARVLHLIGDDPQPLAPGDVQFTVTTTLARTPRGLRLVQVEPEYALRRVERVRPRILGFDEAGWGVAGLVPRTPVAATISVGDVTVPCLRFVSRPEVNAFEGTEVL